MFEFINNKDDKEEFERESDDKEIELKWEIWKKFEQSDLYFKYPPPSFVGESKEIVILLPSDENIAPIIKGLGNSSFFPLTINSFPDGNEII